MSKPIKEYSLGKCKAAIFQSEYNGKPTYSVKFQKSYQKDGKWNNTDYFNLTELRDLYGLIGCMLDKQVKERIPGQNSGQNAGQTEAQVRQMVKDTDFDNFQSEPMGQDEIPF